MGAAESIPYLSEEHLFVFLAQILVLLTTAKVLGELFQRRGIPALAGEILTGVLLGPTIFGRAFPSLESKLFPPNAIQEGMLETVSWLGVLCLLLATGFEVSISSVWKQGRACLIIGFVALFVPMLIGCGAFCLFPESYWGISANRLTFSLFMATATAISAVPVVVRVLYDLDILKSDFGLITLSSRIVIDVLGWMIFTFVIGIAAPGTAGEQSVLVVMTETILFVGLCLTVGSKVVGGITKKIQESSLPQPGASLTFVFCLGLMCGEFTQWIGVHAILGFFLAGIMAGNAPEISENTREIFVQMIHAIFVPIFFATIGIKVDFFANFDLTLIAVVTVVAVVGKFVGAWAGGRLAGQTSSDSFSMGLANIAGGAMEVILGILGLELRIIPEKVFVALVFAAFASSIAMGPLLAWSIRRRTRIDISGCLLRDATRVDLSSRSRWQAIEEMCRRVAQASGDLDVQALTQAVQTRERIMGTGLERGVAVPHARLEQIESPIVAFGRSKAGIEWDSRDGLRTHFVFLILTPAKEQNIQVQILASIARTMMQEDIRDVMATSESGEEILALLNKSLGLERFARQPAPNRTNGYAT